MKKFTIMLLLVAGCLGVLPVNTSQAMTRKPMERDKAIATLYNNFQYDKADLGKYLDSGMSYMELKNICLHAYAAQEPLGEVVKLRSKYVWPRVKFLLGLTPEKFAERELDYKADRLERLFGINKNVGMKYLKMGFAAHQIKRASFLAAKCDKSLYDILLMKTRQQKWGDIAEQLGLPRDACMK